VARVKDFGMLFLLDFDNCSLLCTEIGFFYIFRVFFFSVERKECTSEFAACVNFGSLMVSIMMIWNCLASKFLYVVAFYVV
jgi:hypothetical protein